MTNDKSYRLDNYRITVYDDVLVRWEHHAPLGMARSGKCFLYKDVLIIGKKNRDEDGFLVGEFLDRLHKLPPWTGTRYYCSAGELIDAATGQGLSDETLERCSSFADRSRFVPGESKAANPGTWRLGRYRISVAVDHAISWQASGELNRIISGLCNIESDILIIGPQVYDEQGQSKQKFHEALNALPQWDRTTVWCHDSVLRPCLNMQQKEKSGMFGRLHDIWKNRPADEKLLPPKETREPRLGPGPALADAGRYGETAKKLFLSSSTAIKSAWQRVSAGSSRLKCFVLLIVAVVLTALTAFLDIAEDGFHCFKKHQHKHHDHD